MIKLRLLLAVIFIIVVTLWHAYGPIYDGYITTISITVLVVGGYWIYRCAARNNKYSIVMFDIYLTLFFYLTLSSLSQYGVRFMFGVFPAVLFLAYISLNPAIRQVLIKYFSWLLRLVRK